MIGVTGATGTVGGRVASLLAERGLPLRLVVRDAVRAPTLPEASVREAPGGYAAFGEMRAALAGVETLFLVPAHEAPDRVAQHRAAVDAAVAAGVSRIVYLSFLDASPSATFTLVRDHWATEEHVRGCGVAWTFVRMSLYMDFLPAMVVDGVIRGPAGSRRMAAVLRADVAAAAAAVLAGEGHDGRTYDITGPEAFTLAEAAEEMSRATGRSIRFEDETEEEAYESRRGYGAPDWQVRAWVTTYLAIRDGLLDRVSPDFHRLTGREPTSLAAWLRRAG